MAHAAAKTSATTVRALVLLMALAALLCPVAAWADTVNVLLDDGTVTLVVRGGQGGQASGRIIEASGPGLSVDLQGGAALGPGCAGTSVQRGVCLPGTFFIPGLGCDEVCHGTATYAGVTYNVRFPGTWVDFLVSGDPILLPPLAATFSASVPFDIRIGMELCEPSPPVLPCPHTPTTIDVLAIGHGVATFSFIPDPIPFFGDWALESGIYEIQPIPEPGTWLLVPTAVGLAWLARKKRQAIKNP